MSIASGQEFTSLPLMTASAPGALSVQNDGPVSTGIMAGGGTVTANGVTPVPVVDARVTANSIIIFTLKTATGTVGAIPAVSSITPGTGFSIVATAADLSVYNYAILG